VGRMLRQQAAALTSVPWQVLQLADTNVPGRFKVSMLNCSAVRTACHQACCFTAFRDICHLHMSVCHRHVMLAQHSTGSR
jgi:hypothetical protein